MLGKFLLILQLIEKIPEIDIESILTLSKDNHVQVLDLLVELELVELNNGYNLTQKGENMLRYYRNCDPNDFSTPLILIK